MTHEGGRTLVTGWFSFLEGEATAGDVLALDRVRQVLAEHGVPYDVAWSPRFRPRELTLADARPGDYDRLVFVCGPVHGPRLAGLHQRFAHCRRIAVGVSVVDPADPAVTGFHQVLARDGTAHEPQLDLSLRAPASPARPVVGVVLTHGQREYGEQRLHEVVTGTVRRWLAETPCAPVALESRLDAEDGLLCGTAAEFMAVLGRLDAVVTDRLHGLVLALRAGVPPLAVDPVRGGAKVTAQARACHWPAVLPGELVADHPAAGDRLNEWLSWCLDQGAEEARRRLPDLAARADPADALPGALAPAAPSGTFASP